MQTGCVRETHAQRFEDTVYTAVPSRRMGGARARRPPAESPSLRIMILLLDRRVGKD